MKLLYLILFFLLIIALSAIFSRNPIQAVLFLILCFLLVALIFLLIGAEFLALLMIIVYVGAISILFLFIVMMLNLKIIEIYNNNINYIPIILLLFLIFILEISILILLNLDIQINISDLDYIKSINAIITINNLMLIGQLLYNYYIFGFLIVTVALFVSMIGCIKIIK